MCCRPQTLGVELEPLRRLVEKSDVLIGVQKLDAIRPTIVNSTMQIPPPSVST